MGNATPWLYSTPLTTGSFTAIGSALPPYTSTVKPTYDYTPADQDLPLCEALDKPLHRFSEGELHDLCEELNQVRWAEKEQTIRRVLRDFMLRYTTEQPRSFQQNRRVCIYETTIPVGAARYHGGNPASGTLPSATTQAIRIRVAIPYSVPAQFVNGFAERMIRDQIDS